MMLQSPLLWAMACFPSPKTGGQWQQVPLDYKLTRTETGMRIHVTARKPLPAVHLRLGPFKADSKTGELAACQHLPGIKILQMGLGFIPPKDNPKFAEHRNAAGRPRR